jgi:hypothetical protein
MNKSLQSSELKNKPSKNPGLSRQQAGLFSWLELFLDFKDGDIVFLQTSIQYYRTIWRYVPEDRNLHSHRWEKLTN